MNKPAIYIQANIHAGEVKGKEAILRLIDDFVEKLPLQRLCNT